MTEHLLNGNCWEHTCPIPPDQDGQLCDVCHKHAEPRGQCRACMACEACEAA